MSDNNKSKEAGSIMIYTLMILLVLMMISAAMIRTLMPKFRLVREAVYSTMALYAADSALEWCAYSRNLSFLSAYYKFDEGAGASSGDSSGNNNELVLNNPRWITGQSGSGLEFNGLNEAYVPTPTGLDMPGSFTLASWIRPAGNTTGGSSESIVIKGDYRAANYGMRQILGQISCFFTSGGLSREHTTTSANLLSGVWRHAACVLDDPSDTMTIYLDGQPALIESETGTPDINTGPLRIGQYWLGQVDEVKVYDSPVLNLVDYQSPAVERPHLANDSEFVLYQGSSVVGARCEGSTFDHRAVGTYQGISRSLEVF